MMLEKELECESDMTFSYYDWWLNAQQNITNANTVTEVTNYQYEEKIENAKRNIYLLKQNYLNIVLTDMDRMMAYKTGSTQYVSETLVRGENIKLYS